MNRILWRLLLIAAGKEIGRNSDHPLEKINLMLKCSGLTFETSIGSFADISFFGLKRILVVYSFLIKYLLVLFCSHYSYDYISDL